LIRVTKLGILDAGGDEDDDGDDDAEEALLYRDCDSVIAGLGPVGLDLRLFFNSSKMALCCDSAGLLLASFKLI